MTATRASASNITGGKITSDDAILKGAKLPTNLQVIRCMKYHQQFENLNQWDSAEVVLKQVKLYYAKANLEDRLISDSSAKKKLIRYLTKDNFTRKTSVTLWKTEKYQQSLKEHEAFLNKTFIITTPDALSKPFLFEDDRKFLISVLEDWSATIRSHDRKNFTKLQLKQQKRHKVERKKVELSKARAQFEVTPSENISCLSSTSDSGNSQDEIPGCSATPTAHQRTVKTGAILEIPYDILSKSLVVKVMTRCGISPSAGSAFLQSILLESQYSGNEELTESQLLSKFTLSYASCDRYKRKQNYSMSEIIKESWTPPMIYNIHWDSKLVPQFQDKYNKIEIMPVLVSNGSNTKLLGVPSFCPGAEQSVGSIIGDFTYNLLIE